jgi:hypothetical protein
MNTTQTDVELERALEESKRSTLALLANPAADKETQTRRVTNHDYLVRHFAKTYGRDFSKFLIPPGALRLTLGDVNGVKFCPRC